VPAERNDPAQSTAAQTAKSAVRAVHGRLIRGQRVRVLADHFARMIPRACTVLDVGSGDGLIDAAILEQRPGVSGCSGESLRTAFRRVQLSIVS